MRLANVVRNSNQISNPAEMAFKYLRLLFFFAFSLLLFIEFSPFHFTELINGTGVKINRILIRLCYAYIGSFIFYYLVVYIKRKHDTDNIEGFVSKSISLMYFNYRMLIYALQKGQSDKKVFPTDEHLKEIFEYTNPNTDAPLAMGVSIRQADWFDFFDYIYDKHHNYLLKLESLMPHLSTDLIRILTKSDFKTHKSTTYSWYKVYQKTHNKPIKSLSFTFDAFKGYRDAIKELYDYHEKVHGDINKPFQKP